MSGFRLLLAVDGIELTDRVLDWDLDAQRWRLSDKERGSVTWVVGSEPGGSDLGELRRFFAVPSTVPTDKLVGLSPGQLTLLHQEYATPVTVHARLCEHCRSHWIVYRFSNNSWTKYGRSCEGLAWWGEPLDGEAAMDWNDSANQ